MKIWCDGSKTRLALAFEGGSSLIETLPVPITTNQAEYKAILAALHFVVDYALPGESTEIFSDSQLAVRQINRDYTISNLALDNLALCVWSAQEEAKKKHVKVILTWIPREENRAGIILEEI